ncbi:MAG: DUF1028 domain-containing protein [Rhizobiales bacterium]|nr:DUF1028 domain-containing protein [Hyphomicrobiales bacterium]
MTWSIIARDAATGEIGVAVSTCAFAVGARVPYVETGVGAIATQSYVNPFYGLRGLELLRAGASAADMLRAVTDADEGRDRRQVHAMDSAFRFAAYTGGRCIDWCGHLTRETFSVAGNMLTGPEVIAETARVFEATEGPLSARFVAAMRAGQAAGGDRRGKQSAAMLIHDGEEYPLYDLRVDDHAEPIEELARLLEVANRRAIPFRSLMPRRADPVGINDPEEIERRLAAMAAARRA